MENIESSRTATDPSYGFTRHFAGVGVDDAQRRIVAALQAEGFGILTEIDVKATLKKKLDRDVRPYRILGACNPALAHQALEAEKGIGLLLPCNVCVWEEDAGAVVSIGKPEAMFEIVGNPSVKPIADQASARLQRALAAA
jgi:uncharacterized protein (DUF302 family)